MKISAIASIILVSLAWSGPSLAANMKFCLHFDVQYDDAGIGEDYWSTTSTTSRPARGMTSVIKQGSTERWSGQLGDGLGTGDPGLACTGTFYAIGGTLFTVETWSWGKVQGNTLNVRDQATGSVKKTTYTVGPFYSSGTYTIHLGDPGYDEFNVYSALAYGLYRHSGGLSSQTFNVDVGSTTFCCGTGSCFSPGYGKLCLTDGATDEKFLMLHELGHAVLYYAVSDTSKAKSFGCSTVNESPCTATSGHHSIASKEVTKCAFGEGFAHFYAADVFNSHNQTDCWFEYYKTTQGDPDPAVNCESANGYFDAHFMEQNCTQATLNGRGVELDWLRQLWDVHTNGGSPPSFNDIIDWIDDANAWDEDEAYDELDAEANTVGGSLNSNWDSVKGGTVNGIDH